MNELVLNSSYSRPFRVSQLIKGRVQITQVIVIYVQLEHSSPRPGSEGEYETHIHYILYITA